MNIVVRRLIAQLALPGLVAGGLAVGAGAPAAAERAARGAPSQVVAPVPRLDWQPCGAGLEPFLCTKAEVPTDYDHPRGPTTTVALTKLPASGSSKARLGTLFTNPGGPGGSGVEFVQLAALAVYPEQIRAQYDILGFDPRGVAGSDPATCFRTQEDEASSPLLAVTYPVTRPQERRFLAESRELAVRCQTTSPVRFANASTANVARDMDLLRQAVGDQRLTYIGYSYGTFLGATYAKLFPGRVGKFVLDGPVDPVAWTGTGTGINAHSVPLGIRIGQSAGGYQTFREFARLCREGGPANCPLAAAGDPAVTVLNAFDRLLKDPLELPLPDGSTLEITQQIAVAATFQSLYAPAAWPDLAQFLLLLVTSTADPEKISTAAARTPSELGARLRGEDYPSIGGALASLCVDGAKTGRPDRYPAFADAADARSPYFGRFRTWVSSPCESWKLTDDDAYQGPWQQTTRTPVMVIGTRSDPATPYRNAHPYANRFPDARLVTHEGWGHPALIQSTCVTNLIIRYLIAGQPPADGINCSTDVVPFTSPVQAVSRSQVKVPAMTPVW
ncbi:MAG TPA: alpha/beta hydrolase [Kineosporiaceae bacterium]|nr:alpha/beta hydrolase [Kineosporiaceae bacterium]